MVKTYISPKVDFKKKRKSFTLPDQSMTIQEIVKRFVKGVPVDVVQRDRVYVDQSEFDLEKMSRMDFAEKAAIADDLKQHAEELAGVIKARNDDRKEEERAQKNLQATKQAAENKAGIGPLDSTMPVDTKTK